MARLVLITSLIISVCVLVGCNGVDTGRAQIMPSPVGTTSGPVVDISKSGEADLVEKMAASRQDYRRGLEMLIQHYNKTGNNMKLTWAKEELQALDSMPKYNYIIEATMAGPDLKATKAVPEADYLYNDAVRLEEQAGKLVVIKDDNLLRMALDKYNMLISKYPSSDKIDDASYHAAGICEHFGDYSIAVLYYQRTYQWDPETNYPARYKAAYILDKYLHRRAEALQMYQDALEELTRSGQHPQWEEYAKDRAKELIGEIKPPPPIQKQQY
jgi:tetratricopeptide (TPR) repeat protein